MFAPEPSEGKHGTAGHPVFERICSPKFTDAAVATRAYSLDIRALFAETTDEDRADLLRGICEHAAQVFDADSRAISPSVAERCGYDDMFAHMLCCCGIPADLFAGRSLTADTPIIVEKHEETLVDKPN